MSVEELKAKAKENMKQAQNAVKSSAEAPKPKPTPTTATTTAKPKPAASPEAVAARSKMPYESSAPVRSLLNDMRKRILIIVYRLWIRLSSWIFWKRRMQRL